VSPLRLFIEGCAQINAIPHDTAEYLFDLLGKFALCTFRKNIAVGYALSAYRKAYLKAHYPAEFLSAVLTHNAVTDPNQLAQTIVECQRTKKDTDAG